MTDKKIHVTISGDESETAYVALPGHESTFGIVAKTICLDDVIESFKGPRINLDFNHDGLLIGIEVLA